MFIWVHLWFFSAGVRLRACAGIHCFAVRLCPRRIHLAILFDRISLLASTQACLLPLNRPNCRRILECGGWRGTGLTPLWQAARDPRRKRCVPSPLTHRTLQNAGAGSGAQGALKCQWFLSLRGGEGKGEEAHVNSSAYPNPSPRLRTPERSEAAARTLLLAAGPRWQGAGLRLDPHAVKIGACAGRFQVHEGG